MNSKDEEEEFISGDEDGMLIEDEKPEILMFQDKERVQKVVVKKEPKMAQFLTIQNEECGHTKWLATHNIKEDNYLTESQGGEFVGTRIVSMSPVVVLLYGRPTIITWVRNG